MSGYQVAQYNIGRTHEPLDHPDLAEFAAALEPINAIAESTPGFVWRLKDEEGRSSSFVDLPGNDDPLLIVNYSIWEDLEALEHFIYKSGHFSYLRRRQEWFERTEEQTSVAWWIPAGTIPEVEEAHRRLLHLRRYGPTETGWTLSRPFSRPDL